MTSKKAHKWFIGILFLFGILLLPLVFAYEFDNAKTYNPVDRSITIKNTFLGIPLDTVAKVTPTTPHVNYVVRGQDRLVAEFDIDSYVVYTEKVWDGMKFYDLNSQIHKEINRDFHIKYATYREVEIPTTALECTDTAEINKTSGRPIQECKEIAGKPIII